MTASSKPTVLIGVLITHNCLPSSCYRLAAFAVCSVLIATNLRRWTWCAFQNNLKAIPRPGEIALVEKPRYPSHHRPAVLQRLIWPYNSTKLFQQSETCQMDRCRNHVITCRGISSSENVLFYPTLVSPLYSRLPSLRSFVDRSCTSAITVAHMVLKLNLYWAIGAHVINSWNLRFHWIFESAVYIPT